MRLNSFHLAVKERDRAASRTAPRPRPGRCHDQSSIGLPTVGSTRRQSTLGSCHLNRRAFGSAGSVFFGGGTQVPPPTLSFSLTLLALLLGLSTAARWAQGCERI